MERVELDNIVVSAEDDTGQREPQPKSETDHEHSLTGINDDLGVNSLDAEEYPPIFRRAVIVVGVALALFCVRHQDSLDDHATLTSIS